MSGRPEDPEPQAPAGRLRPCGTYATWQGRERRVTGRADLDEMQLRSESDPQRSEGNVPVAELGTIRKVVTTAQWRGGEIIVGDFHGADAVGFYCNDSALARREELYGDQYSGWTGVAPVADLSDVRERVTVLREPDGEREPTTRTRTVVDVSTRAAELGADLGQVVVGSQVDVVPAAPSGRWVLFPTSSGGFVVGGRDRGDFAPFASFGDPEDAALVLARWSRRLDLPVIDRTAADVTAAAAGARQVIADAAAAGPVTAAVVPVGAPFDHIGSTSGHVLYLYGTPMSQRSLPPTDLNVERVGYLVSRQLPESCRVATVPGGFGQPGGGLVVKLDRVLAYYIDTGMLTPFAVPV